jgi:hypothetical protein
MAQKLVSSAMKDQSADDIFEQLEKLDRNKLSESLYNDQQKLAFWINIYNGTVQHALKSDPSLFEDRSDFFDKERVMIAGESLSLDDIEHGLIRSSTFKLSLGYLSNPFTSTFEKQFRVENIDPRIHFALNCGAKSCPAVAIYDPEKIDQQLEMTAREYLTKTTKYFPEENRVMVSRLISWFRGDFGGLDGAMEMLKSYQIIPQNAHPEMDFLEYDWTLLIENYKSL